MEIQKIVHLLNGFDNENAIMQLHKLYLKLVHHLKDVLQKLMLLLLMKQILLI